MKRIFTIASFGFSAAAIFGCPVYSGSGPGGPCVWEYGQYSCGEFVDAAPPWEAASGDCAVNGCPSGQVCALLNDGGVACVTEVAHPDGGVVDGGVYESGTLDATDANAETASDAPVFTGCASAADCTDGGAGTLCLDGLCVPPANQCTDTTQCPNSEECVQGACVPGCSSGTPCSTGYSCTANNVCTGNPTPCGSADGGAACSDGTICVEQHCVTPCGAGDAACSSGLVCVGGGCIPEQQPVFTCATDGVQGACDTGSICLHHSCYIACDPEASNACATADVFNLCKPVTTSSGTYHVCGSSTNLGSQCDPTRNIACTPSTDVCIDGFCH